MMMTHDGFEHISNDPANRSDPVITSAAEAIRNMQSRFAAFIGPDAIVTEGVQTFAVISGRHVACVPKEPGSARTAGREVLLMRALEGRFSTVEVPVLRHFDAMTGTLIVSRMRGEPLCSVFDDLSDDLQVSIGRRLGVFMKEMHRLFSQGLCDQLREIFIAEAEAAGFDRIDMGDMACLHRDLHSKNILYDIETDTLSVIDFTDAGLGRAQEDFFKMDCFPETMQKACFRAYNRISRRPLGIQTVRDYFDRRMAKMGSRAGDIPAKYLIPTFGRHFSQLPEMVAA